METIAPRQIFRLILISDSLFLTTYCFSLLAPYCSYAPALLISSLAIPYIILSSCSSYSFSILPIEASTNAWLLDYGLLFYSSLFLSIPLLLCDKLIEILICSVPDAERPRFSPMDQV